MTGRGPREMTMSERRCPWCNRVVVGHPNKRFCRPKCKDRFWNHENPRGYFAHRHPVNDMDSEIHPFSQEAFKP